MPRRPALSLIVPARNGLDEIGPVLDAAVPQALQTGSEIIVVGRVNGLAPDPVRLVRTDDPDLFRLHQAGLQAARGEIVAIGEDHAVPRPDWFDAVIRAHAEHADTPGVAGCLINGTEGTVSARAMFLVFGAGYQPPLPEIAPYPPPVSSLSVKRSALSGLDGAVGRFESEVVPRLHAAGQIVPDDRIVVDHYQDHGILPSVTQAFHSARTGYGYQHPHLGARERRRVAWWALRKWPPLIIRQALSLTRGQRQAADLALLVVLALALGLGGAMGALAGPGRSPDLVA